MIDWSNPKNLITPHFTVTDATFLPSWKIYHQPSDAEKTNLISLLQKMEEVRTFLGDHPVNVNCTIRPTSVNCPGSQFHGKNYNLFVGGAPGSAHIKGLAMDFTVSTVTCDDVRSMLEDQLSAFNIRMEKKPGSGWVHIDLFPPNPNRYFKP